MASEPFAGLKVLVVEDEMLVSMIVEDMLADFGCAVVGPAPSVQEAAGLAAGAEIDAAILDVNLAGQAVFPVADALKARSIPYAFASGYGDAGVPDAHRAAPVLQKPFRQMDLQRALGQLVGNRG
ncbi:MAG: response regulator [Pseudomonadota bacterium]